MKTIVIETGLTYCQSFVNIVRYIFILISKHDLFPQNIRNLVITWKRQTTPLILSRFSASVLSILTIIFSNFKFMEGNVIATFHDPVIPLFINLCQFPLPELSRRHSSPTSTLSTRSSTLEQAFRPICSIQNDLYYSFGNCRIQRKTMEESTREKLVSLL